MLANSKRLPSSFFTLCVHTGIQPETDMFFCLCFCCFFLFFFFFLFFWFCDVAFPVAWCHSESTRAARRQVNSNWSKCTCGLSSSQSLGKYPINNPVTTTPVTPTHMGSWVLLPYPYTHPMYMSLRAHSHSRFTPKTYNRERLLILFCWHLWLNENMIFYLFQTYLAQAWIIHTFI